MPAFVASAETAYGESRFVPVQVDTLQGSSSRSDREKSVRAIGGIVSAHPQFVSSLLSNLVPGRTLELEQRREHGRRGIPWYHASHDGADLRITEGHHQIVPRSSSVRTPSSSSSFNGAFSSADPN